MSIISFLTEAYSEEDSRFGNLDALKYSGLAHQNITDEYSDDTDFSTEFVSHDASFAVRSFTPMVPKTLKKPLENHQSDSVNRDFKIPFFDTPQIEKPIFSNPKSYSFNGKGNNLSFPDWGSTDSYLFNIAPLAYEDEYSTPAGQYRPNPRIISNALSQQNEDIFDPRGLTNFIWAWGQFIDHDLDLTPELSTEEATSQNRFVSIPVPKGDPYLDPEGTGKVIIEMRDTVFADGTGTYPDNPRELPNVITGWLDGSQVYGSDQERADALRTFRHGQLRVSSDNLLPLNTKGLENDNPTQQPAEKLFVAGDVRANENVVLTSMHTLFVREHNRLAQELVQTNPYWTDDQIYQEARKINIAQMQSITYNEYLPTLLGVNALPTYDGYDPAVNPNISRVFSTAAFRLGHTQLSSEILRLDNDGQVIPEGNLTLADAFFPGSQTLQEAGIDPIMRGLAAASSQQVDTKVIDDVRNLLFGFGPAASARDLVSINIQRGRVNGLADYNTIREAFGLERVSNFAEITSDLEKQATLKSLYGSVDNIDAFIGLLSEDLPPGASVGKTISTILVNQFTRLRTGDRFYYENQFSPAELVAIESIRLSDIILRNTDTEAIQDFVFHTGDIDLETEVTVQPAYFYPFRVTEAGYYSQDNSGIAMLPESIIVGDSEETTLAIPSNSLMFVTYRVKNSGKLTLDDINFQSDDGSFPDWMGGDSNSNQLLDPGETWEFTALKIPAMGPYQTTMTVSAVAVDSSGNALGLPSVSTSDTLHYVGIPTFEYA